MARVPGFIHHRLGGRRHRQRIGTYLMNEIVVWAQQWPEAKVRPI